MQRSELAEIRRHLDGMAREMDAWAQQAEGIDQLKVRSWARRLHSHVSSIDTELDQAGDLYSPEQASRLAGLGRQLAVAAFTVLLSIPANVVAQTFVNSRAAVEASSEWEGSQSEETEWLTFQADYLQALEDDDLLANISLGSTSLEEGTGTLAVVFNHDSWSSSAALSVVVEVDFGTGEIEVVLSGIGRPVETRLSTLDGLDASRATVSLIGHAIELAEPDEDMFRGER